LVSMMALLIIIIIVTFTIKSVLLKLRGSRSDVCNLAHPVPARFEGDAVTEYRLWYFRKLGICLRYKSL
jgi:hypothetical protein